MIEQPEGLSVHTWSIRIQPPAGGAWQRISTSADDLDTEAVAVDHVQIRWGRPTPFANPTPGSGRFTLLVPTDSPDNALLQYDAGVRIRARFQSSTNVFVTDYLQLTQSWIQSFNRTTASDGRYRYDIELMDILGRAAATTIGMTPRNRQTAFQRLGNINFFSPAGTLIDRPPEGSLPEVLPRDVDNYNALSLAQETVPVDRYIVEGKEGRLNVTGLRDKALPTMTPGGALAVTNSGAVFWKGNIQASWIVDAPRVMARTGLVSQVALRMGLDKSEGAEEYTRTVQAGFGTFSTSRLAYFTDTIYTSAQVAEARQWASSILIAARRPALALAPTSFLTRHMTHWQTSLFEIGSRDNRLVRILGGPDDLEPVHMMTGATLNIHGITVAIDNVELHPGSMFGIRALRFSDLNTDLMEVQGRPRLRRFAGGGRISSTSVITTVY